tara:strand:+ start:704 stop:922 length:219 start_codon:yes stop_codon:yes gene_type:complete
MPRQSTCSVDSALSVCGHVASDPVAEFLRLNICELLDHFLVVVEVVGEFLPMIFNKMDGSNFDKTWSNISHN